MVGAFLSSLFLSDIDEPDIYNKWEMLIMGGLGMYIGMMAIGLANKNNTGKFLP